MNMKRSEINAKWLSKLTDEDDKKIYEKLFSGNGKKK